MNKEIIEEGNKLIADFVGLKFNWRECNNHFDSPEWELEIECPDFLDHDKDLEYLYDQEALTHYHLKFHTSWDWIMPVAEKISKDYDFSLGSTGLWVCTISRKDVYDNEIGDMGGHEPVITNVFLAIVQFIKWYNTQSKHRKIKNHARKN